METPPTSSQTTVTPERLQVISDVALALEASFLAQMLELGGLGESRDSFGGGAGEDAFSSLLVQEQATLLAESGGIGLAEHIVTQLLRREGND